ncbi:TrkH family potassium uptake protein [Candidatus Aminicenantes bacterium AH-873-B07]|nr:TrkH family potassium uptake protein [Candidatus Aminicenantes bacterium AH-873-B07]
MNHIKPKKEFKFQPAQVLAISFLVTIFIGTFLLLLPISTNKGNISFIDALFTATSATCVTGLIVVDTPNYFSLFGQIVILTLLQLGGLGIMTFTTLFLLARGKRISIRDRFRVQEDFHHSPVDVKSLIRDIFIFTFTFEFIGTILLFIRWNKNFPFGKALYISLFHSISAFCNAGFSLFSDSLTQYKDEWLINLVFFFLIICGGLGFLVLREIKNYFFNFKRRKKIKISLHTKLVLIMTLTLILVGACFFFIMENNSALKALSWHGKIFASFFQVITPRTAGFNTIDLTTLNKATILFLIGLMFIGASPGSTGGGVKTTTVGVIFFFLKSKIIGRESVNLFYRTLPQEVITKAFTVVSLALGIIFLSSFALFIVESSVSFENALFEVFSAFGTVGLSLGTTSHLSNLGKVFIIITMYVGRIGPLTLLYALGREKAKGKFEYIEEKVMIG